MKLTDQQQAQLVNYIKTKWAAPATCSVCRQNSWQVATEVLEIRAFHGGSMVIGGKNAVVPLVPVTCQNCGNTVLLNALIAGLDLSGGQDG
ncbi:MAG: hypothetical protein K8R46_09055 [Pirellulales bacterium]|nr:hypothetical protein [Pirellulales bacterium]